jgi:hypothetical protein
MRDSARGDDVCGCWLRRAPWRSLVGQELVSGEDGSNAGIDADRGHGSDNEERNAKQERTGGGECTQLLEWRK